MGGWASGSEIRSEDSSPHQRAQSVYHPLATQLLLGPKFPSVSWRLGHISSKEKSWGPKKLKMGVLDCQRMAVTCSGRCPTAMKWAEAAKMDQQIRFPTAKETQKVRQQSSITPAFTPTASIPAKPGHGRAYATPAVHDSLGWGKGLGLQQRMLWSPLLPFRPG